MELGTSDGKAARLAALIRERAEKHARRGKKADQAIPKDAHSHGAGHTPTRTNRDEAAATGGRSHRREIEGRPSPRPPPLSSHGDDQLPPSPHSDDPRQGAATLNGDTPPPHRQVSRASTPQKDESTTFRTGSQTGSEKNGEDGSSQPDSKTFTATWSDYFVGILCSALLSIREAPITKTILTRTIVLALLSAIIWTFARYLPDIIALFVGVHVRWVPWLLFQTIKAFVKPVAEPIWEALWTAGMITRNQVAGPSSTGFEWARNVTSSGWAQTELISASALRWARTGAFVVGELAMPLLVSWGLMDALKLPSVDSGGPHGVRDVAPILVQTKAIEVAATRARQHTDILMATNGLSGAVSESWPHVGPVELFPNISINQPHSRLPSLEVLRELAAESDGLALRMRGTMTDERENLWEFRRQLRSTPAYFCLQPPTELGKLDRFLGCGIPYWKASPQKLLLARLDVLDEIFKKARDERRSWRAARAMQGLFVRAASITKPLCEGDTHFGEAMWGLEAVLDAPHKHLAIEGGTDGTMGVSIPPGTGNPSINTKSHTGRPRRDLLSLEMNLRSLQGIHSGYSLMCGLSRRNEDYLQQHLGRLAEEEAWYRLKALHLRSLKVGLGQHHDMEDRKQVVKWETELDSLAAGAIESIQYWTADPQGSS